VDRRVRVDNQGYPRLALVGGDCAEDRVDVGGKLPAARENLRVSEAPRYSFIVGDQILLRFRSL
jgi:hypothetical protein